MHVYKLTLVALYQKCQNYIFYSSGNSACDANILIGSSVVFLSFNVLLICFKRA